MITCDKCGKIIKDEPEYRTANKQLCLDCSEMFKAYYRARILKIRELEENILEEFLMKVL